MIANQDGKANMNCKILGYFLANWNEIDYSTSFATTCTNDTFNKSLVGHLCDIEILFQLWVQDKFRSQKKKKSNVDHFMEVGGGGQVRSWMLQDTCMCMGLSTALLCSYMSYANFYPSDRMCPSSTSRAFFAGPCRESLTRRYANIGTAMSAVSWHVIHFFFQVPVSLANCIGTMQYEQNCLYIFGNGKIRSRIQNFSTGLYASA